MKALIWFLVKPSFDWKPLFYILLVFQVPEISMFASELQDILAFLHPNLFIFTILADDISVGVNKSTKNSHLEHSKICYCI